MKQNNTYCPPQVATMPMKQASNVLLCTSSDGTIMYNAFSDAGNYAW